ncbi:MAG TPA: uroporphyrinogen decarboxylase family protein [Steroidobacteraceae bacterium]
MTDNALCNALARRNSARPPVWFMRQAGRYHRHYQRLRQDYDFVSLCKVPKLATEVTLGPMRDFNFDAAILFSDLLFPLEAMGMGLQYTPGPTLDRRLDTLAAVDALASGPQLAAQLQFQADAVSLIRRALPMEKGLIGFAGGPWTLFVYGTDGSHQGELSSARRGLTDGRYERFCERLTDLLAACLAQQAQAGADAVAIFDTAAGELSAEEFATHIVPPLRAVLAGFRARAPATPVIYYSKNTTADHWRHLEGLDVQCLGVDWHHDLAEVLERFGDRFAVQGNVDPEWLLLPQAQLEARLRPWLERIARLPARRRLGWVCGLGHGVLQRTPEDNVRRFLQLQREIFDERS